tara:strand:- start:80 stop:538 length:459 start_codon:yes stop_codon:yes gene_type:complete
VLLYRIKPAAPEGRCAVVPTDIFIASVPVALKEVAVKLPLEFKVAKAPPPELLNCIDGVAELVAPIYITAVLDEYCTPRAYTSLFALKKPLAPVTVNAPGTLNAPAAFVAVAVFPVQDADDPLVFWLPVVLTPGRLMLAEPLKDTPPMVRAV